MFNKNKITKYRYNPKTLSFDIIEKSLQQKLIRFCRYTVLVTGAGVLLYTLFSFCIDSPQVVSLKRERTELEQQIEGFNVEIGIIESEFEKVRQMDDSVYRTIYGLEPLPESIREAGFGGVNRYASMDGCENEELVIGTARRLDKLLIKICIQKKSYDDILDCAFKKIDFTRRIPAIQPIDNKDLKRIASGFGLRLHPILRIRKMHNGMDFTAPRGTPVYATGSGKIEKVKYSGRGYGNMIVIDHEFGYKTLYAHLFEMEVKEGQFVRRGELIGYVGNTGFSTGPHLHYEIHKNGIPVNPVNYYFSDLSPWQYQEVIALSERDIVSYD